jgi:hypothetical protein
MEIPFLIVSTVALFIVFGIDISQKKHNLLDKNVQAKKDWE